MSTMGVVFTGICRDADGTHIVRTKVVAAASAAGFRVQPAVRGDTAYLVSSRMNTIKAEAARSRGVKVLTYPLFLALIRDDGAVV